MLITFSFLIRFEAEDVDNDEEEEDVGVGGKLFKLLFIGVVAEDDLWDE